LHQFLLPSIKQRWPSKHIRRPYARSREKNSPELNFEQCVT